MKADPKATHVATEFKYDSPFISCRFHPAGRFVFATAEDRSITRWDLEAESQGPTILKRHDSWVRGLVFSKDGQILVSSGYDDQLIWWSALDEAPEPLRSVRAHEGWIRTVAVSPDGQLLASAGNDRVVKLWRFDTGELVRELAGHERDVYSARFHPSGEFLLSGDLKGRICQWEVSSGRLAREFDASALNTVDKGQQVDYGGVRGMDLSVERGELACAGLYKATNPLGAVSEPLLVRFNWETGEVLKQHVADGVEGIGWRVFYHPDDFLIGCSGGKSGGFLLFWRADEDKTFHQFKLPDTARDCDLHPDGTRLVTGHYDRKLRIAAMSEKAGAEKT